MIPLLLIRLGDGAASAAVDSASLEFSVLGMRLHWSVAGEPVHYTMNPARCHYDA